MKNTKALTLEDLIYTGLNIDKNEEFIGSRILMQQAFCQYENITYYIILKQLIFNSDRGGFLKYAVLYKNNNENREFILSGFKTLGDAVSNYRDRIIREIKQLYRI
jgi:hypothetical protein